MSPEMALEWDGCLRPLNFLLGGLMEVDGNGLGDTEVDTGPS